MKAPHRDDALRAGANDVARVLKAAGHQVYFAGGCVRDLVLGLVPKDYDIATDATPEQVQRLFRRTVMVGAAFGVVRAVISGQREYEIATFRTEGAYVDGRRPSELAYTTSHTEDVERRDFTINALLLEPETDEVIDVVGGLDDLSRGVIRAVGDAEQRFAEDKLRMLRAVRFSARLGFAIEPATEAAIARHAPTLDAVSIERIVTELQAIWATTRPGHGLRMCGALGLWPVMFPWAASVELEPLAVCFDRLPELRTRRALDDDALCAVGWALLLDRAAPDDAELVLRASKLSRERMRTVLGVLGARPVLDAAHQASLVARGRVLVSRDAAVQLAYAEARHGPASASLRALDALAEDHRARPLPASPLVTGADLKAMGLTPGPAFKAILAAVEDAVLERRVTTREAALALARTEAEPGTGLVTSLIK